MAPPINRDIADSPPSDQGIPGVPGVPLPPQNVPVPQFRFLKPSMFNVKNMSSLVMGLEPQFHQAFWDSLARFDSPQGARNMSSPMVGMNVVRQLMDKAKTAPPPTVNDPVVNQPPPADPTEPTNPGAYDPTKDPDYLGNTYVPPPGGGSGGGGRDTVVRPKIVTNTGMGGGAGAATDPVVPAQEPGEWINGVFYPLSQYSQATLDFMKAQANGTTGTPVQRVAAVPPPINASTANSRMSTGPVVPQVTQHTYGGYNYLYDPRGQRYVRAGRVGARRGAVQFAGSPFGVSNAASPNFISAIDWDRLNPSANNTTGSAMRKPSGGGAGA